MFIEGYEAKIVVGIQGKELDENAVELYYDNLILTRFATIPNAKLDECVVGFEVASSWENIEEEIDIPQCSDRIDELLEEFFDLTGIRGKVFLIPVVGAT